MPRPGPRGLEQREAALALVQDTDFRAASLFELVRRRLRPGSVLDVGCGSGGLVGHLARHGIEARGVDTNAETIEAASRYLEARGLDAGRVRLGSVDELVGEGVVADNVTNMDCLEHIEDDRAFFARLVRVVRPGGRLVVTVPALRALFGPRDVEVGHHRRYEREQLLSLAREQRLRVEEIRYWNAIGVVPTFVTQRLLGRAFDDSFRYAGPRSLSDRVLLAGLRLWFARVENPLPLPLGMTLAMVATRPRHG